MLSLSEPVGLPVHANLIHCQVAKEKRIKYHILIDHLQLQLAPHERSDRIWSYKDNYKKHCENETKVP